MKDRWIKASEIGEFLYCQRAWWYRLHGFSSANVQQLEQGTEHHLQHSRRLFRIAWQRSLAFLLIVFAMILLTLQWMQ